MVIDKFRDEYEFLSNFFPCNVEVDGIVYHNSEAAFQAQKTLDDSIRKEFALMTANVAKKQGKKIELRKDVNWQEYRDTVMYTVCRAKFEQNPDLCEKLLQTGDAELIEGNTWRDFYWGVCNGKGQNRLGKILMQIRQELSEKE